MGLFRRKPKWARCATIEDPTYMMFDGVAQGYYPYTCPAHGFSTLRYEQAFDHWYENMVTKKKGRKRVLAV